MVKRKRKSFINIYYFSLKCSCSLIRQSEDEFSNQLQGVKSGINFKELSCGVKINEIFSISLIKNFQEVNVMLYTLNMSTSTIRLLLLTGQCFGARILFKLRERSRK